MKQLDEFSATAQTTQGRVLVVDPTVLKLQNENPYASLQQVHFWWKRYGGNLRKVAKILELGRTDAQRIMLPGLHHQLAMDRPQGGPSESWMDPVNVDTASANNS